MSRPGPPVQPAEQFQPRGEPPFPHTSAMPHAMLRTTAKGGRALALSRVGRCGKTPAASRGRYSRGVHGMGPRRMAFEQSL